MRDPGKVRRAGTIGVFVALVLCLAVRGDTTIWPLVDVAGTGAQTCTAGATQTRTAGATQTCTAGATQTRTAGATQASAAEDAHGGPTTIWPLVDVAGTGAYAAAVADALAGARETIDVLLSSVDLEENPLVDGLVAARGRAVRVRVLVDQSDWEESITVRNRPAVDALRAAGIDAQFDDPGITTHAKLVIVDAVCVVVGSTNWNRYALYEHRQAGVRIDDPRTAEVFEAFFERQWTLSGRRTELALDEPIPADGAPAIVAIPDDDGTALYGAVALELLGRAQRSVHAVLYRVSVYPQYADSVTGELVAALVSAAARGVDVRVVIDDCRFYEDSAAANLMSAIYLYQSGVDVRFDDPDVTTHAKLLVIDGESILL
ncbi:MAG: phospholipase D-like domain-containing protein, partial [Candidatus Bipolaricaulis sp.]|nr:phospholipase D-like domain-containing protein [Candidatus Bipolaricaulis sp.]